ncbi:MAG: MASE1 domain-containing protein, partial [Rhizobiaceae bacterium]|nr:MASE1 domain-containing protein [Rhizobiaceae bacterium]
MTCVWSYRPQFLHLSLFAIAYVLGCGFAQSLAIVPGTGISIWPPSGLFITTLVLAPRQSWPWWVLAGCLAELFSNAVWFHSPFAAAVLIYAGNAVEAVVGALLVDWTLKRPIRLETLREVLIFVVLCAGIAPIFSATIGSAVLQWFGIYSQTFVGAWPLWWIGDATGVLIVAPLALVVFQNWRRDMKLSPARWLEACALGLIFLGVATLSLSGYLPFAYIIMPPLLWASARFEFKGAAITLVLLALITAFFTITGASEFVGDPETQRHRQIMLQLFLVISAFSALIVAAISRQHQLTLATLHQSVEALRDRERELSQLVNMVPAQIRRLTPEGEPTFFNRRLLDFFGLADVSQLDNPDRSRLATAMKTFVHPEDSTRLLNAVRHSVTTGEPNAMKYRMLRADGVYRWVDGRWEPLRDDDGTILEWFAISIDIDDEVRAQEALQQSERRYRDLFHYMPIGLTQVDASKLIPLFRSLRAEGITDLSAYIDDHPEFLTRAVEALEVEEVNQHIVEMFGAKNAEEMYGPISRYWQPGLATIRRSIEARYRGEEVFQEETRVARMDGSVMDVVFATARPGAVADKSLVGFIDITERRKAEEALKDSKQQLEQMIDAVPFNILSFDPAGRMTYASKRYQDQVGRPAAQIKDFDALARDVAHPEDFPTMFRRAKDGFATGKPFVNRFRRRVRNGGYRWIEARAQPLRGADDAIVQWYIASIDIEEEMRAQEALRERERFLWQLVETLPAMIDCAAPNGEPVYRSQQLREFLGYELEELDGTGKSRLNGTLDAGVHPDDVAGVKEQYARSLASGEPYLRKHRLRRFDGEYVWVETRAAPMRSDDGTIVQWNVICLDVDGEVRMQEELRLAQERLARASQAASLAELSASIAHEVNQPLAAIVANSHACYRWLSAEPVNVARAKITTERVIRDANSAAEVVSRIRALFRQSVENRTETLLSDIISEAHGLMAGEALRRRIRIDIDVDRKLAPVAVDRIQVQQVLINLIRNGMEAMSSVAGDRTVDVQAHRVGHE